MFGEGIYIYIGYSFFWNNERSYQNIIKIIVQLAADYTSSCKIM